MDLTNLPELATQITVAITPALPFLLEAGKEAVVDVAADGIKRVGKEGWEKAKKIWHVLWPKVQSQPAALEAARDAAQAPDDDQLQAALCVRIRKLLEQDPALAQQIAPLVQNISNSGRQTIASGNRTVAVGGNANGARIVTGDNNH